MPIRLDKGWEYRWGDAPDPQEWLHSPESESPEWKTQKFPDAPPGRNGQTFLWQRVTLPAMKLRNPTLYVHAVDQAMEVYLGEKLIHSFGNLHDPDGDFLGYPWHAIHIPASSPGTRLTFRVASEHVNIGIVGSVLVGEEHAIWTHVLRGSMNTLIVSVLTAFIGAIGLWMFISKRTNREYLFFGVFGITIGVYLFTRLPLRQIFCTNGTFWGYLELASFFGAASSLVGIIDALFPENYRRLLRCLWQLLATYGALSLTVAAFGLVPVMKTLLPFQLMVLAGTVLIIMVISQRAFRGNQEAFVMIAGFFSLLLGAALDILVSLGLVYPQFLGKVIGTPWGVFLLLLSFGYILTERFLEIYRKTLEHERNLVRLAEEGRKLSAETTMAGLVRRLRKSLMRILRVPLRSSIFFAESAFIGEPLPAGFYALTTEGHLYNEKPIDLEAVRALGNAMVVVTDARSNATIAAVPLRCETDEETAAKIESLLQPIANNLASAITTVRLEKTFAMLEERTSEIRTVFEHINQGILMIDSSLRILPEHSHFLSQLFGNEELAGRDLMELVFGNANLGTDQLSQIKNCLASSLGEDLLAWEANSHMLPREMMLTGQGISLEIDWTPIADSQDMVHRLMITLRDVTTLKALKAAAAANQREMEMLGQIVGIGREKFEGFLLSARRYARDSLEILEKTSQPGEEEFREIKRSLHTIKGNARTLNLTHVTELTHQVENTAADILCGKAGFDLLRCRIEEILHVLDEHGRLAAELLGWSGAGSAQVVEILETSKWLTRRLSDSQELTADIRDQARSLMDRLLLLSSPTLRKIVTSLQEGLRSLANELDRPTPLIILEGAQDWVLHPDAAHVFEGSLMHLTRNSLDHGFTDGSQGRVVLRLTHEEPHFLLYQDSGAGLNLAKLHQMGLASGLLAQHASDDEIAETMFASGVSTAEVVTSISGRGVGMGAVRSLLERAGMQLTLEFTGPRSPVGCRPFRLRIAVPAEKVTRVIPQ